VARVVAHREHLDAGVEAGGQNNSFRQRGPEAGRDREPVLRVEVVLVLTAESQEREPS
jgi:hypothetical protein